MATRYIQGNDKVQGSTDGVAPAAGYVGEQFFAKINNASITAAAGVRGLTTLTITTTGYYTITAQFSGTFSSAPGGTACILSTNSATSNLFPEHSKVVQEYTDTTALPTGTTNGIKGSITGIVAPLAAGTVLYLNVYTATSLSISGVYAWIAAVRIA